MKLTLKNGKALEAVSVEESYYPRNTQGVVLSIRLDSDEDIETLKETFSPAALETIKVGEGEDAKTLAGYTRVDSIRKLYGGDTEYNTAVDLTKRANASSSD